ncbi:hypothetical protein GBA52_025293 [Prunus armeniaca]|nr:hypothetical protein GBA52_025293 [Prunus armeniaca]
MVAWLVLSSGEFLLSFSPYCPSAGFYNLWGQPTSNFKRLCDFERDGERERRGRMDGWCLGV